MSYDRSLLVCSLFACGLFISVSCLLQDQTTLASNKSTFTNNNGNVTAFNSKNVIRFFAKLENDEQKYGQFYRALLPTPPPPPPPPPAPMPKMLPCKASMTFGFGDAAAENPCTTDPDGNIINPHHMKLLAAAMKSTAAGRGMPAPDRSKDVPGLYDRVGRVLNPDAPKDYETYKQVYDRMMQANGEGAYANEAEEDAQPNARDGRSTTTSGGVCTAGCQRALPTSCCPVRTQIVYPQFARSAVTDQMIAIVQDMHNFVQPIYKRMCTSLKCNFMRGNCTQKYLPQTVFSAPLTAVQSVVMSTAAHAKTANLTEASSNANLQARKLAPHLPQPMFGQDIILVESGCECRPDFETGATYSAPEDDEYDRFD